VVVCGIWVADIRLTLLCLSSSNTFGGTILTGLCPILVAKQSWLQHCMPLMHIASLSLLWDSSLMRW
jgi:hypothetical protein